MTTIENGALAVIEFWKEAGPKLWFAKDEGFDRRFREAFYTAHLQAARRDLESWMQTPEGALALLLLLDQFPRNTSGARRICSPPTRWRVCMRGRWWRRGWTP